MVAKLRAPGLYRACFAFLLGIVFATGLTWLVRMATGHATYPPLPRRRRDPGGLADRRADLLPGRPRRLRLLVLLGLRHARRVAEDHSSHGAYSWKDYFRINTDHKVIGIQYTVTAFFFLFVGRLDGDADAHPARPAGRASS